LTGSNGDSQTRAYYGDSDLVLGNYALSPTLVSIPEMNGDFSLQLYSSYTISANSTQSFYFFAGDILGINRYDFFDKIQSTNYGIIKHTLRMSGGINNDFRIDSISYDFGFSMWTINTTTINGTTDFFGGGLLGIDAVELFFIPGSLPGVVVTTTQSVPTYSAATGEFGETRFGLSGSTPYLYYYTNQWYRFQGLTF
jgi:hypothetical protein